MQQNGNQKKDDMTDDSDNQTVILCDDNNQYSHNNALQWIIQPSQSNLYYNQNDIQCLLKQGRSSEDRMFLVKYHDYQIMAIIDGHNHLLTDENNKLIKDENNKPITELYYRDQDFKSFIEKSITESYTKDSAITTLDKICQTFINEKEFQHVCITIMILYGEHCVYYTIGDTGLITINTDLNRNHISCKQGIHDAILNNWIQSDDDWKKITSSGNNRWSGMNIYNDLLHTNLKPLQGYLTKEVGQSQLLLHSDGLTEYITEPDLTLLFNTYGSDAIQIIFGLSRIQIIGGQPASWFDDLSLIYLGKDFNPWSEQKCLGEQYTSQKMENNPIHIRQLFKKYTYQLGDDKIITDENTKNLIKEFYNQNQIQGIVNPDPCPLYDIINHVKYPGHIIYNNLPDYIKGKRLTGRQQMSHELIKIMIKPEFKAQIKVGCSISSFLHSAIQLSEQYELSNKKYP